MQFVQVAKLSLLGNDDVLLFFLNVVGNLSLLVIQVDLNGLDVVKFILLLQQRDELFFLRFEVDYWSSLGHATWWVGSEAEEVSEYVTDLFLLDIASILQLRLLIGLLLQLKKIVGVDQLFSS